MKLHRLRCEYLSNPIGIDAANPRLTWEWEADRRGVAQSAYQIVVARSEAALTKEDDPLWDSGIVKSDQSVHVPYAGPDLKSRQRCYWRVRAWDEHGQATAWSEPAFWEMVLLDRGDWKGAWIGSPIVGGPYSIPPAPYLRKGFELAAKPIAARLYVTALGLYEFEINGHRVGDCFFTPGRTEYGKRVPYHVFDVLHLVRDGLNACGAILGDGWYCGHLHSDPRQTYGDRPRLLAQIVIDCADGRSQIIATDTTWKTSEGPIRSSDMLMGEDYDARLEIPGWSSPDFNDSTWRSVLTFDDPDIRIVAHRAPPIRKTQELKPIAPPVASANKRRHVFDLGQNMVGYVRLRIRNAPPGKTIDLRFTEMLDKDGKPYTTALRSARATDHYTTKGGDEEFFEPRFTFHGFRYVEVRDYPGGKPTVEDVTGIVLHSDAQPTGEFTCSDAMINQLQSNITWSQRGNFLDIPTDCPQRDERLGWTGDAQVFIRTAAFNMDVANFFTKWLADVADAQYDDGHIPSVVPHVKTIHHEGGPAWADAAVICPWTLYLCYGDTKILEDCWPMMSAFLGYLKANCRDFIRADEHWKWKGYGDWLSVNADTSPAMIGTGFYAYCAALMAKIARVLGQTHVAEEYESLFANVRAAWQRKFLTADGTLSEPTQTAYVLALHFDLLPGEHRAQVADALVADIQSRGMHLSTGFVGTPYLNPVLTRFGQTDIAYALLLQKTFPSWLFPLTHGATTMWERWDGWTPEKGFNDAGMNSYNHYAFGAIGEWMYANVGGIDLDPLQPGYKHILIRPEPGGGMHHASARLQSMYGAIESSWRVEGDKMQLDIVIPANTSATVRLPTSDVASVMESDSPVGKSDDVQFVASDRDVAIYRVGSGRYRFRTRLPKRFL